MGLAARHASPHVPARLELLVLGAVLAGVVLFPALRGLAELDRTSWKVRRTGTALLSIAPVLVGGVSLTVGVGGGMYWTVTELVAGLSVATRNAWIVLIGIRR